MGLSDLMRAVFERSLTAGEADLRCDGGPAPGFIQAGEKHEPRMIEIGQGIDKGVHPK
jgi:hypothetical protein